MSKFDAIIKGYLERRGLRVYRGQGTTILAPVFIMDAQYQIWCKDIRNIPCKHLMKKYKKAWSDAYNAFNKDFLWGMDEESVDTIIDAMDDFEEFIANDIMIAEVSVMNLVKKEPVERQKVIASCMLCNILAQAAQIVWKATYKTAPGHKVNPHIAAVQKYTMLFLNEYHTKTYTVHSNEDKPLSDAVTVLCNKITQWINNYMDEN